MADNYDTRITDTSMFGGFAFGSMKYLSSTSALKNSIMMWLSSFKGDYIGQPSRGGILTSLLSKPMRDDMIPVIRQAIQDGIQFDYQGPELQILKIDVQADYQTRRWVIYLEVYAPSLKMQTVVNESVRGV
jgi:phage baseplate assembly protein W